MAVSFLASGTSRRALVLAVFSPGWSYILDRPAGRPGLLAPAPDSIPPSDLLPEDALNGTIEDNSVERTLDEVVVLDDHNATSSFIAVRDRDDNISFTRGSSFTQALSSHLPLATVPRPDSEPIPESAHEKVSKLMKALCLDEIVASGFSYLSPARTLYGAEPTSDLRASGTMDEEGADQSPVRYCRLWRQS